MPRRRTNRRKSPVRKPRRQFRLPVINWRPFANAVLALAAIAALWGATGWLMERPINSIRIEGEFERVTVMQIEAALTPYLGDGVLTASLATLQDAVASLPWVRAAGVRRSWPSTLVVTIEEERAAARWGDSGLLNIYGDLFVTEATHIPPELPQLNGPAGSQLRVARQFFEFDSQLKQRGLHATRLRLDERGAWTLMLSNGIEVRFGTDALEQRKQRFFEAFDEVLQADARKINYIDMRYTNGFAIGWKPSSGTQLADRGDIDPNA